MNLFDKDSDSTPESDTKEKEEGEKLTKEEGKSVSESGKDLIEKQGLITSPCWEPFIKKDQ